MSANISSGPFASYSQDVLTFSYLPDNHFSLSQGDLPGQEILGTSHTSYQRYILRGTGKRGKIDWQPRLERRALHSYC